MQYYIIYYIIVKVDKKSKRHWTLVTLELLKRMFDKKDKWISKGIVR